MYMWNSMWGMVISITLVGYGDFVPVTHLGRVVIFLSVILGNILFIFYNIVLALTVVSLSNIQEFSPQQRKAFEQINQEVGHYQLYKKAIEFIRRAFKYRLYIKKNLKPKRGQIRKLLIAYRRSAIDFSRHRQSMNSLEQNIPQESLLVKLSQQMTSEFDKILLDSRGIKRTMIKLEEADRNQSQIDSLVEKILTTSNQLNHKIDIYKEQIKDAKKAEAEKKRAQKYKELQKRQQNDSNQGNNQNRPGSLTQDQLKALKF